MECQLQFNSCTVLNSACHLPTSSESFMNSNRAIGLIFKKSYLNVQYSDLGNLWLVGKLFEISTSLMLNIEYDLAIFEG